MPEVWLRPLDAGSDHDVDLAYGIVRACELADDGYSDATRDGVRSQAGGPDAVPAANRLAGVGDDAAGLLLVERSSGSDEAFIDVYAAGPHTRVLERALVEEGVRAASSLAGVSRVTAASYAGAVGYRECLSDAGFGIVRTFWRMRQDLTGVGAEEPVAPHGVERRVVRSSADLRELHRMRELTFAEHYGNEPRSFEHYVTVLDASAGADPEGRWLALLDGEPVGLCIVDDSHEEFDEGYVRTLGVLPEARGRGIARWLLGCAAADAVRRGRTAIALTVDGENTTGATALYRAAGYEVRAEIDVWERSIVSSGGNESGLPSHE